MFDACSIKVQVDMEAEPPFKIAAAARRKVKPKLVALVDDLKRKAFDQREPGVFFADRVGLGIVYRRGKSKRDPANAIGGIADALKGILYRDDDRTICEIHYMEEPAEKGSYSVIVAKIE